MAYTFCVTQNVIDVVGWDGSMKWSSYDPETAVPKLADKQHYFRSWCRYSRRAPIGAVRYNNLGDGRINIYNSNRDLIMMLVNGQPDYSELTEPTG